MDTTSAVLWMVPLAFGLIAIVLLFLAVTRGMFNIAMIAAITVTGILAVVGFAILGNLIVGLGW